MKELKNKLKKNFAKKQVKPIETEFQADVRESAAKIDDLIASIDNNNDAFKCEIDLTEFQLKEMDNRIKRPDHSMIPGKKIQEMIDKWGQEETFHPDDLEFEANELWLTRQEFERKLEKTVKGTDLIIENLKNMYEGRIERLK